MTVTREELHHLVDELDDDRVPNAAVLLRELAERGVAIRRTFRSLGIAEAAPDLAERSEEILRQELGEGRPA